MSFDAIERSDRLPGRRSRGKRKRTGETSFRPHFELLEARVLLTADPLTPGDLVVYRVGDSSAPAGTSSATPVYLDEYTTSGTLVQSIALNGNTANGLALTDSGKASSGGQIALSSDGSSINLFGYDVSSGTAAATGSMSETAGIVGASGAVQLEGFTDEAGSNARSAAFDPSTGRLYTSGGVGLFESAFSAGGVPVTNEIVSGSTADVQIVNGAVLYLSGAAVFSLGGEPTTATTGTSVVNDGNGPGQFFFARLGSGPTYGTTGDDTLYVTDDKVSSSGTLFKYSWTGSTWAAAGSITGPDTASGNQIVGVTGIVQSGTATIYFTEGNTGSSTVGETYKFTDSSSSGTISNAGSAPVRIVDVSADENFRGIVVAPDDGVGAIGGLGNTINYSVDSPATVIGSSATFSDASSFNGGSVVVSGGESGDTLSIISQGTGAGQIGVSGNVITYAGTQIGTFTGGNGTTPLAIHFDSVVNTFGAGSTEYAVTSAAIQTLIHQVAFASSGATGSRNVSFQVTENNGLSDSAATQTVNVVATDAPSIDALGTLSINENAGPQTVQLSGIGNDGNGQTLTVTAVSDNAALVPNSGTGALAVTYSSPDDTGTLSFTPTAGASGTTHILVTVADGAGFVTATETVNVIAPPILTVPGAQNVIENVAHTFSTANGDGISIADAAVGSSPLAIALTVNNGTLALASNAGLTFTSGANGQSSMTVSGSVANINAALNGLAYTPAAGYSGADTLQLAANDLGNTASGIAQMSAASVALTVLAPPSVMLNEIDANPPGTQDNRYEYIELRGTPGASLNNVDLVVFNGIVADNLGVADLVLNLSGRTLGSNGLLVIKSSIGAGFAVPAGTTVISDPTYFTQTGGLPDGTLSFYLFYTTGVFTSGTDYDTKNDGILDSLPADSEVLDDVGLLDNNASASGDKTYGSAVVFEANATGTPDAVTRFTTADGIGSLAWYGGDLIDTGNIDSQIDYDPARESSNEPAGAYITPGDVNYPHRTPILAANNTLVIEQGASGAIGTAQLQVTDPDDTSAQLAYSIVSTPTQGTLEKNGTAMIVGNTFTQADIDNGIITYLNTNSSATNDSFTFTVNDGAGGTLAASTFNITLTPFQVTSFTPNATGFAIALDAAPNLSVLNLYSGSSGAPLGTPDMTVLNGSTPVVGSLVWDPTTLTATFIQTRGILAPGTYNVTLASRSDGWVDASGNLLDAGSNYTTSFTVAAPTSPILTLPDFGRGPGQPVNVDDAPTGYGTALATSLPVSLSNTTGVTSVSFELDYNSSYLNISNVTLASGISGTLSFTNTTPGVLLVSISGFSSTATPGAIGGTDIVDITAMVPAAAISTYGASAVLKVVNPQINGSAVPASDSVEKVAYFGDASGAGKVAAADATLVARNRVHLDSGFSAYPLTDPRLVADIVGTGTLSSADALLIAQAAVHLSVPNIPAIPSHGTITLAGADPTVGIPANIAATTGQVVDVPVSIMDNASGVASADFAIHYDPAVLSLTTSNITLSSTLTSLGWAINKNVDSAAGIAYVSISATAGLPARTPQLLNLAFSVASTASTGTTAVSIDPGSSDLASASGNPLPLSVISGSVAIAGAPSTPTVALGARTAVIASITPAAQSTSAGTTSTSSGPASDFSLADLCPSVAAAVATQTAATVDTTNPALPHAAASTNNSLEMAVSLSTGRQPAAGAGPAASFVTTGPPERPTTASPVAGGLNQAAVNPLPTAGSRQKSDTAARSDAVDPVLADPWLEW